ncbi:MULTISPECIES: DUF397 domain-containing protein [Streptomyces]|uniref:DUF397 domain-containing protein n=1 Tax=Streptomyces doudnae TaxID=3075536 RepID=A0ABD5EL75_9ACTN|nr:MULTISPECIES: DUF397 domain-containing protein [unclassified Streptomyces]MDT0435057.1 DUF397 domain-containing protein [Streptomyces sp. DSM 41981]MYQ67340.1 DUF397 domain-containing protein [Streptomyces sp. SID4950]SCE33440.1 protein of unknown function [Streptomyces sp. SolWspMP-5a-2]
MESTWCKSSYSDDQSGNCVEVTETDCRAATVSVRDSKAPAGPMLTLASAAFSVFADWAATGAG